MALRFANGHEESRELEAILRSDPRVPDSTILPYSAANTLNFSPAAHESARDRHLHTAGIPYGSKTSQIVYGEKLMRSFRNDGDEHLMTFRRRIEKRSQASVAKAENLVEALSSPNPDWSYAAELFMDLIAMGDSLFQNRSFYTSFLTDMGSVLKQRASVEIQLRKHPKYKFPIGYEIKEYSQGMCQVVQPLQ